jgi:hypothetical protein
MEAEAKKKAEDEENAKADGGMKLVTPADLSELSAVERARIVNAENAKARADGSKPRAGSSKVTATPKPKPADSVNLSRQVRNEEAMRKSGKLGKTGDVAVSISVSVRFGLSDLSSRLLVARCARVARTCVFTVLGSHVRPANTERFGVRFWT